MLSVVKGFVAYKTGEAMASGTLLGRLFVFRHLKLESNEPAKVGQNRLIYDSNGSKT